MRIELRGIIQTYDNGHRYVDLLVTEDRPDNYRKHRMGVDIKVDRGRILSFLAGVYKMPAGKIIWPRHIEATSVEREA